MDYPSYKKINLFLLFAVTITSGSCSRNTGWISMHEQNHPLVGKIWHIGNHQFVERQQLLKELSQADYVLLGEKHDNPDHHRLQAGLLTELAQSSKYSTVGFEQILRSQQAALTTYLSSNTYSLADLGRILRWKERGWPNWQMYEPIFRAALDHGLALVPVSLSLDDLNKLQAQQYDGEELQVLTKLGVNSNLPFETQRFREKEIAAAHCEMLPVQVLPKLVTIQRIRDALMAYYLVQSDDQTGILIAGNGHIRTDGVPTFIRQLSAACSTKSVAFLEVDKNLAQPEAYKIQYNANKLPFDFVWFTPVFDPEDPCKKYKSKFEKTP